MATPRKPNCYPLVLAVVFLSGSLCVRAANEYISAVGGRRDSLRLAIESWNQCNEIGVEVPNMGNPRAADCFDIYKGFSTGRSEIFAAMDYFLARVRTHVDLQFEKNCSICSLLPDMLVHRVTKEDNKLGVEDPFLGVQLRSLYDVNLYATEKELYLGSKCQVEDTPNP
ncbi:uncharacterized protein LOC131170280 [Hevea brasiliensis]|uniref:uncharacterized protein LOC131170280 n=1 Tax=Hevea brasiliensis TaxID=3981 RepID=UPI0025E7AA6E|nr:uncharacterized protein LOC131170280 [Hevea brasiliensis]